MQIPGLPEAITRDQMRDAIATLGLPLDEGRITSVTIKGDAVEVTFIREAAEPVAEGRSLDLLGGRGSMAIVTVPIAIRPPL